MTHLTPSEFVDLLEGQLPRERARHADDCELCGAQVETLRRALDESAALEVPEPSPLFWNHLSERVQKGIQETPEPHRWWPSPQATLAWAATLVLVAVVGLRMLSRPVSDATSPTPVAQGSPSRIEEPGLDDEGWAAVRAAADGLGWDDVQEAGISAQPGLAEGAILGLSEAERQHLMKLLEEELKQSGA
jgi:hypothetical protein